jgi:hypothetical protein
MKALLPSRTIDGTEPRDPQLLPQKAGSGLDRLSGQSKSKRLASEAWIDERGLLAARQGLRRIGQVSAIG